jgi:phosphoenolpyruvate-protein kinase (PTS system EI component)
VHIELANELSPITSQRDLMLEMRRQQLVISEQEKVIRDQRERIQQLEAQERQCLASFESSSSSSSSSSRIELDATIDDGQVQLKVLLRPAICEE